MKVITRMELKVGMELGEDVIYQGNVLYPAGREVTTMMIDRINRYGIMCVTVMEEVDYATTHFQRIQYDTSFQNFVKVYGLCLAKYKGIMISFLGTNQSIEPNDLIAIYHEICDTLPKDADLLDYLYNMAPSEDEMTYSQCLNSALLCGLFGKWLGLSDDDWRILVLCGFYYDIGKWNIPMEILWKPGKLTDEEFALVKKHPVIGYALVRNDHNLNEHVKNTVIMHHERMDASGYPYHMQGEKIDKFARIMGIVDTYIAMASPRTFRKAFTPLEILSNLEKDMYKYDPSFLLPIMKQISETQIGVKIKLSDGTKWNVVMKSQTSYGRPILKNEDNQFLDLSTSPELKIEQML